MVGIEGLNGIPDPRPGQPAKLRSERQKAADNAGSAKESSSSQDNVAISSEAKAAAEVMNAVAKARTQDDVRMEKVEAARERIAKGEYKDPEVVRQVAQRVMKFLA